MGVKSIAWSDALWADTGTSTAALVRLAAGLSEWVVNPQVVAGKALDRQHSHLFCFGYQC